MLNKDHWWGWMREAAKASDVSACAPTRYFWSDELCCRLVRKGVRENHASRLSACPLESRKRKRLKRNKSNNFLLTSWGFSGSFASKSRWPKPLREPCDQQAMKDLKDGTELERSSIWEKRSSWLDWDGNGSGANGSRDRHQRSQSRRGMPWGNTKCLTSLLKAPTRQTKCKSEQANGGMEENVAVVLQISRKWWFCHDSRSSVEASCEQRSTNFSCRKMKKDLRSIRLNWQSHKDSPSANKRDID